MTEQEETAWRAQIDLCTDVAAIDKMRNHLLGVQPTGVPGSSFRLAKVRAAVHARARILWDRVNYPSADYDLTYGGRQS